MPTCEACVAKEGDEGDTGVIYLAPQLNTNS